MFYILVTNNWPERLSREPFEGYTHTFETETEVLDFYSAAEKWRPLKLWARLENNWPVEIRETPWEGATKEFSSQAEFENYCIANSASAPTPEVGPSEAEVWRAKLTEGWLDPVTKIRLKTTEEARNLFAGQVVMIREAIDQGQLSNDVLMPIWDFYEQPHTLSVGAIRNLLIRYGMAWQTMFNQYAP